MHVANGDRIFLRDNDSHAQITRSGILGISEAMVMECDDGVMRAYCGDSLDEQVINVTTGKNGRGESFEVPVDVRLMGPSVLASLGIDEDSQTSLFQKFMVLPKETRREKIALWNTNKDDATKRGEFLTQLLDLLDDDDLFIKTQSASLLRHVDEDVRTGMLTKFYDLTTKETRKAMIVEYTRNKNDKFKTEEFLQNIYNMTLTDDQYLRMELKRSAPKFRIKLDRLDERIDSFMTTHTDSYRERISSIWRSRKYYRSKTGPRFAWILLRKL